MRSISGGCRGALLALCAAAIGAGCATTAREAASEQWYAITTPRFELWTNGDPEQARELVADLERFHQVVLAATTAKQRESAPPLKIFLADDAGEFAALSKAGLRVVGKMELTPRGTYAVVDGTAGSRNGPRVVRTILFGAYAQYVLATQAAKLPAWYRSGFSTYMATTQFHADDAGDAYTVGCPPSFGKGQRGEVGWRPIGDLFAQGTRPVGNPDPLYRGRERIVHPSAQSWYAFHYFASDESRQRQLKQYLELWAAGTPADAAITRAFGTTPQELDNEIRRYSRTATFECLLTKPEPMTLPELSPRPVSVEEAHLNVGDLLLSIVGPTDETIGLLKTAAAGGTDAAALRSLARAHGMKATRGAGDRSAELQQAQSLLQQAQALEPDAAEGFALEGHFLRAQVQLMREGDKSAGKAELAKARRAYRKAVNAKETLAEAYYGLGLTYVIEDNGSEEAIAALEAAALLLPFDAQVQLALGTIELHRGRPQQARSALEYALHNSAQDAERADAQAALDRAHGLEQQAAAPATPPPAVAAPAAPAPAATMAPATVVAPPPPPAAAPSPAAPPPAAPQPAASPIPVPAPQP